MNKIIRPCVIGLGYVGLPIFLKLSKSFTTCGYDINKSRVTNLKKSKDVNLEFKKKDFNLKKQSFFTSNKSKIDKDNVIFNILAIPVF